MLEHQKYVLKNVSSDKRLFRKELLKSFKWLNDIETVILIEWVKNNFMDTHYEIISEVFENHVA
jgi:type IV secretory pathway TrbF-like protein